MQTNQVSPVECLSPDALSAFGRGRLPTAVLEAAATHVSGCAHCASALASLPAEEDSLVRELRRHVPAGAWPSAQSAPSLRQATTVGGEATGTAPPPLALPRRFGRYELLEELGRGGMGIVYKARQAGFERLVAVKMTFEALAAEEEVRARFRTEGQAVARLEHAGIVRVYEFGEEGGRAYFSMEYLGGGTLAQRLRRGALSEGEAAGVVRALAEAVEHAHVQGVVHRDLKPGNVLLDGQGRPKVSDFGMARLLDAEVGHTLTNAVLGTPAYMAPEQAWGDARNAGPAADVYGLGAVLYECLTGRPPFKAETREQTLAQVRTKEPERPSRHRAGLSPALEAVCLRCLEKLPERRYGSAGGLAEDLGRWLAGEPTAARPPRWHERLGRVVRRHRVAAGVLTVFLAVLAAGAALGYVRHPDRPLWEIRGELAAGKRVVLIGETGGPRWSRWRIRSEPAQQPVAPARETFAVQSWDLALVELVPAPTPKAYRLSAEVRHEDANTVAGQVGLYVAHEGLPAPRGEMHQFIQCSFNDISAPRNLSLKPGVKGPPPGLTPVRLVASVVALGTAEDNMDISAAMSRKYLCRPSGQHRTGWRKLVVEVTPVGVRGLWENDERIGELTFRDVAEKAEQQIATLAGRSLGNPLLNLFRPGFAPRGGLGLFVRVGSASFRNVTVEPLSE